MIFSHDYYFPPNKEGKSTVLCMRCGVKVKAPGMTKEQIEASYREKPMIWENKVGVKGRGIIILCPACLSLPVPEESLPLIHRQIMKGLEDEAKWAKLPFNTELKDMKIMNKEAA